MYSLTLTVHQVMELFDLRGSLFEHDGMGRCTRVASWETSYADTPSSRDPDEVLALLRVIAQWAERTIEGHPNG